MRTLGDHFQHGYHPEAQHNRLSIEHAQQLWNEWEIQCLVLVSFSLQVFLLFFAGFRKRYRFRMLSFLLWLAYLSADTVAVFVLGRLTRVAGEDSLVLFWAPFMLLHLGGQETITAFSMEDCALWKRHLLNLTTQVALAIYAVGKQWRGNKQLVAPMVLMFISGTTKYVERIWRLGRAGSWTPGSRHWVSQIELGSNWHTAKGQYKGQYYAGLRSLIFSEKNFEVRHMMEVNQFLLSMEFFMNIIPKSSLGYGQIRSQAEVKDVVRGITSSDEGARLAYKVAEIQLSLIYDYLYTKFGSLKGVFHRLTILVLTSTALALFVVHHKGKGRSADAVKHYGVADVAISYVLLVGAVVLEISSILMWLMSSYWPYIGLIRGGRSPWILSGILKRLPPVPESRMEWSGKLQQYNLIDERIQKGKERPHNRWLKWMMWCIGDDKTASKHVAVSPEVKKVFLDKLCEIATCPDSWRMLEFTSFNAGWATHYKPQSSSSSSGLAAAQRDIRDVSEYNKGQDIVSSALVWHLVTDICLLSDENEQPSRFRTCSQHLSNYVMHLLHRCNLMLDSDGQVLVDDFIKMLPSRDTNKRMVISLLQKRLILLGVPERSRGASLAVDYLSSVMLKSELAAADRWEMIATVWVEMLCYIARNCDHGFHAKQLCAGGEFLTHAKMLVFLVF